MTKSNDDLAAPLLTLAIDPTSATWGVLFPAQQLSAWSAIASASDGEQPVPTDFADRDFESKDQEHSISQTEDAERQLRFGRATAGIEISKHLQNLNFQTVTYTAQPLGKRDSLRVVACWFGDNYSSAVVARRSKGHEPDRDELILLATGEKWPRIEDPRLSTTTDGNGMPLRFTIQTWMSESEEGDLHPWLVVGNRATETGATAAAAKPGTANPSATESAIQTSFGDHTLSACRLECFRRGQPGVAILAILRPN